MAGAWSFDSKQDENKLNSQHQLSIFAGVDAAAASLFNKFPSSYANSETPHPDSPLFSSLASLANEARVSREDRSFPCFGSGEGSPFGVKREDLEDKRGLATMWPHLAAISSRPADEDVTRAKRGVAAFVPFVAATSNPDSLSKADADFGVSVLTAAAEVAAADADAATAALNNFVARTASASRPADVDVAKAKRGVAAFVPFVAAISNPDSLSKADADFGVSVLTAAAQIAAADADAAIAALNNFVAKTASASRPADVVAADVPE